MKMRGKRLLALMMALTCFGSIAACGGTEEGESKETVIRIVNFGGGVGDVWLKEAGERFAALHVNEEYETGKTGVKLDYESFQSINTANMNSDSYNLYFTQGGSMVRLLAQQDFLVDISDIVTAPLTEYGESATIEDKISEEYREMCKGLDGKYYGLPHYEFFTGLSFDRDLFDKYNFYLAKQGSNTFTFKGMSTRFIMDADEPKSCGPDGEYGNEDDGLPSSLEELILLCAYMKSNSVYPFALSGKYHAYANHLVTALWTSLAGYDEIQTIYSFSGEVEVVKDFSSENLFGSMNYIKKPNTEKITITEQNGYRAYDSVNRYYALAFLEIADKEGWFTDTAWQGTTHTEEQRNFIWSDMELYGIQQPKIGMLIDGTYWYNESKSIGSFDEYYDLTGKSERKVEWMSLPIQPNGKVAEGAGEPITVADTALSFCFMNSNIKQNEGLLRACKEFLQFLYTDAELKNFSKSTGIAKAVNYSVEGLTFDSFPASIQRIKTNGKILHAGATNKTYMSSPNVFNLASIDGLYMVGATKLIDMIHNGKTAQVFFTDSKWNAAKWATYYQGE